MNLGAEVWRLRRDVRLLQALLKPLPRTLRLEEESFALPFEMNSGLIPGYRIVSGLVHIEGWRLIPHGLGSAVIEVTAPGNIQFQPYEEQYTLQVEAVPELRWRISSASPPTLIFDSAPKGYVVQRTSALSPADWKTLSEVFPAEVPVTDAMVFFRLFQGP